MYIPKKNRINEYLSSVLEVKANGLSLFRNIRLKLSLPLDVVNALSVMRSGRQKEIAWCIGCASWCKRGKIWLCEKVRYGMGEVHGLNDR